MALEYGAFKIGKVRYPLPLAADTGKSFLADADPAVYHLLEYYEAMITQHMGDRIEEAFSETSLAGMSPVMGTCPYSPDYFMTQTQFKFPLLCVYRVRETLEEERTVSFSVMNVATFHVDYILPPLTAADMERLNPILASVVRILHNRSEQGFDPEYTPPGGNEGDSVLAAGGIERLMWVNAAYGGWDRGEELPWQGVRCEVQVREILGQSADDFDDIETGGGIVEVEPNGDDGSGAVDLPNYELLEVQVDFVEDP